MRSSVKEFIRHCSACQLAKPDHQKPAGLLQPLPIPINIWSDISLDFITGLPLVKGKSVILVVVDRLSKYAHFIAMAARFSAASVAAIFVQEISRLHCTPTSIVSDRDPIFMSTFWQEFFRLSGTQLHHTSAYHPQSDGQTEVTNRDLEMYLRCFCMDSPSLWLSYLPWAELSYNTAVHSSTKMSPFFAVYGRHPPPLLELNATAATSDAVQTTLGQRQQILHELTTNLQTTQHYMKQKADSHRRDVSFRHGDLVLIKLQPYRQTSLSATKFSKLQRKYFGPFTVLQRIGNVAYKVDLPASARIHPVFHVSKLKPFHAAAPAGLPLPTTPAADGLLVVKPHDIINSHWVLRQGHPTQQVLVQWDSLPVSDATWLDIADFRRDYPDFNLEGKVALRRGGDDTGTLVYTRRGKHPHNNIA